MIVKINLISFTKCHPTIFIVTTNFAAIISWQIKYVQNATAMIN